MPLRLRPLLSMLLLVAACVAPARADDATLERIASMPVAELKQFTGIVNATIAQDTLRMRDAALVRDCLELIGSANSFALGYSYLSAAIDALEPKTEIAAAALTLELIQARVAAFAARVRAEEWLKACVGFVVPADKAGEPRYAPPVRIATAEFTQAVLDARRGGEGLVLTAAAAAASKQCEQVVRAFRGIELYIPYVDKLLDDVSARPEALGPFASRRGLSQLRDGLEAARGGLGREFGGACGI